MKTYDPIELPHALDAFEDALEKIEIYARHHAMSGYQMVSVFNAGIAAASAIKPEILGAAR